MERQEVQCYAGKAFYNVCLEECRNNLSLQPENCHVVFVKSIEFAAREDSDASTTFPSMTNDPFTPSRAKADSPTTKSHVASKSISTRPMAPPTPALVELPTCPVCLERMDESTTGLLTISCQHVFHCSCLQNWRGSGCPVCRYTQDETGKHAQGVDPDTGLNECSICRSDVNLWICLICGNVGCGRYDAAHAFMHFQQTSHCFAMDLTTSRVWDYASDAYVHRIMQNKIDGKMMELPSANENYNHNYGDDDIVPMEKLDNLTQEYNHLMTSQLESQRLYFEEKLRIAADRASEEKQIASVEASKSLEAREEREALQAARDTLVKETIPSIEKERDRAARRAEKFEGMARKLEKEWREEKTVSSSLMERIEFLDAEVNRLAAENAELKETNRDMSFFISGREKLQSLGDEIQEATVSLPEVGSKKKGKGKGKKGGGEGALAGG